MKNFKECSKSIPLIYTNINYFFQFVKFFFILTKKHLFPVLNIGINTQNNKTPHLAVGGFYRNLKAKN